MKSNAYDELKFLISSLLYKLVCPEAYKYI
jgi:hypothetical protein